MTAAFIQGALVVLVTILAAYALDAIFDATDGE